MALRLFAAVTPSPQAADRMARLQRGVSGADWRLIENLHITLRFFGEVEEDVAEDLDHELARIRVKPFDVVVAGAGWFGGEKPRALWLGVNAPERLSGLAAACERAARRAGLDPESRKYIPHVTLAYCSGTSVEGAAAFTQRLATFRAPAFTVDRFYLYSSWLGKSQSRYTVEAEYPLTG